MKAMILAAGFGKRLLPLTENLPKPLLKVGDQTLIELNINYLINSGFTFIFYPIFFVMFNILNERISYQTND